MRSKFISNIILLIIILLLLIPISPYIVNYQNSSSFSVNPHIALSSTGYNIVFRESGYPHGESWGVKILKFFQNASEVPLGEYYSNNNTLSISLTPGRYIYVIMSYNFSYVPTQPVDVINLNGNININVHFHPSAYSEHYQPYFSINPRQTIIFDNLTPSYGPEALSFGVMNSTVQINVYLSSQDIYSKVIVGSPFSIVSLSPTSSFGFINFVYKGQKLVIDITNLGNSTGYVAFNLWSYFIDNFTASLITVPPQFAENFNPIYFSCKPSTGISFLLQAPNYTYPTPLSIWIGGGYTGPNKFWWAQTGFNNWQFPCSFSVSCYSGFGIFSNIFGNYFSKANYVLVPGYIYNFTMVWIGNTTWEFLVNGTSEIEPGIVGAWNTTTTYINAGYDLGFEVLTNARAGYENVTSFLSNQIKVDGIEIKINGTWVKVNLGLGGVGENWYNNWTSVSPGISLWNVQGHIENQSIPNNEIIFKPGNGIFDIPVPQGYVTTYPVYGSFSYPEKDFNLNLNYFSLIRFKHFLRVTINQNSTLLSLLLLSNNGTLLGLQEYLLNQGSYNIPLSSSEYIAITGTTESSLSTFNYHQYYGNVEEIFLNSSNNRLLINVNKDYNLGNTLIISGYTSPFTLVSVSVYDTSALIYSKTVTTNSNGLFNITAFKFSNLAFGEYKVVVNTSTGLTNSTYFYLLPKQNLVVRVINPEGLPIQGAIVSIGNYSGVTNTSGEIAFFLQPGNYTLHVNPLAPYANETEEIVINSIYTQLNLTIRETVIKSNVTFTESGLPNGTTWYIIIGNETYTSTNSTISLILPYGNYTYYIKVNGSYLPFPSSGILSIKGTNGLTIHVSFKPKIFYVTFKEIGLPTGVSWYINLSNGLIYGPIDNDSITIQLEEGNYTYIVNSPSFSSTPSKGSINVNSNITVIITFTIYTKSNIITNTSSYTEPEGNTTLHNTLNFNIVDILISVIVIIVIILIISWIKKR